MGKTLHQSRGLSSGMLLQMTSHLELGRIFLQEIEAHPLHFGDEGLGL